MSGLDTTMRTGGRQAVAPLDGDQRQALRRLSQAPLFPRGRRWGRADSDGTVTGRTIDRLVALGLASRHVSRVNGSRYVAITGSGRRMVLAMAAVARFHATARNVAPDRRDLH